MSETKKNRRNPFSDEEADRNKHPEADKLTHIPNHWMIQNCKFYGEEYRACKSIKGRLYQRYHDGETKDCTELQENYEDCLKVTENYLKNEDAARRIASREEAKVKQRMDNHINNDIWEHRTSPPEDWNAPLPPELAERSRNSLFYQYQMQGGKSDKFEYVSPFEQGYCTIL